MLHTFGGQTQMSGVTSPTTVWQKVSFTWIAIPEFSHKVRDVKLIMFASGIINVGVAHTTQRRFDTTADCTRIRTNIRQEVSLLYQ